jgi:hypothetical protein
MRVGSLIPAGTLLVSIDSRDQANAIQSALAEQRLLKARLELAKNTKATFTERIELARREARFQSSELKRLEGLALTNSSTPSALDQQAAVVARTDRQVLDLLAQDLAAASEIAQLNESLSLAGLSFAQSELDASRVSISAPEWDSVVLSKSAQVGDRVSIGEEILTLADPNLLEVEILLPAEAFPTVKIGAEVRLRRDQAERPLETLKVSRKESGIRGKDQAFAIFCEVESTNTPLSAGMFLVGDVDGRSFENVLAVPRSAFFGDRVAICKPIQEVQDKGKYGLVEWRTPTIAHQLDDWILVTSGIEDGEFVIQSDPIGLVASERVRLSVDQTTAEGR